MIRRLLDRAAIVFWWTRLFFTLAMFVTHVAWHV
jgi:hypothetical protein